MDKKYELIKEDSINIDGHILYRIRALKDFGSIKKGDIGGYIEKEENLSHEGNCWVSNNAYVIGNARVFNDGWVLGNARVSNNALVCGASHVCGDSEVYGDACVFGNVVICGNASISKLSDYITISPIGSENGVLTCYRTEDDTIECTNGCFYGTLEEFKKKTKIVHKGDKYWKQYKKAIKLVKEYFNIKGE